MLPEKPAVAWPSDCGRSPVGRRRSVFGGGFWAPVLAVVLDEELNFGRGEADEVDREVDLDYFPELEREKLAIPAGLLGEPVVGEKRKHAPRRR